MLHSIRNHQISASIYFITIISVIVSLLSFKETLSDNIMIAHLSFLLFFILAPPVETYVPLISKTIKPLYNWQQKDKYSKPYLFRTILMILFLISLFLCLIYDSNLVINKYHIISIILLLFICYIKWNDKIVFYIIQLSLILFFIDCIIINEFSSLTKLFATLITVSYIAFTIQRRSGCKINEFSSLDLLIILITISGISLKKIKRLYKHIYNETHPETHPNKLKCKPYLN